MSAASPPRGTLNPAPGPPAASRPGRPSSLLARALSYRGRSLQITKAGWLFIVLSLAVGFAAINSGSNLLHVIFGCQMGLIIASGVLSEAVVRRVAVRRRLLAPVHARGWAPLSVEVTNLDARAPIVSVTVEDDERRDRSGASAPVFALVVPAGGSCRLQSTVTFDRRGRHHLPPAVIATAFPFGLFVKRQAVELDRSVLVYPAIHPVGPVAAGIERDGDGESGGGHARSGEFYGLEEFRSGMEKRRIHWPATARLGRPVVQDFEGRDRTRRVLRLEAGRGGAPEFEGRVEEVASLAVAWLRLPGVAVALEYDGELVVAYASGPAQELRILDFLATAGIADEIEGARA